MRNVECSDLFFGNEYATNFFLLGGVSGSFSETSGSLGATDRFSRGIALGDLNGDTHLDVIVANEGTANELLLGDGSGSFTSSTSVDVTNSNSWTTAVAIGDVDGDGNLDVLFGNRMNGNTYQNEANQLLLGDGRGGFTVSSGLEDTTVHTNVVLLGDIDGDGDLDMFIGNEGASETPGSPFKQAWCRNWLPT